MWLLLLLLPHNQTVDIKYKNKIKMYKLQDLNLAFSVVVVGGGDTYLLASSFFRQDLKEVARATAL